MNRTNIIDTDVLDRKQLEEKFDFGRVMGEGSYGAVHEVTCRTSGLNRALKVVPKPSAENFIRLQREILIMKRLDHPAIIRLFRVYEDPKHLYFVMEICKGGELFDRIVNAKYFAERTAASVMKQVLSALAYSHANNIMHRDLKPENVLYQHKDDGDAGVVKLIDWGFSAKYNQGQKFRSVVGTPFYVAPEVLGQYYDHLCDLWSAGVLLYILLCGAPPFFGNDNKAILKAVQRGKFDMSRKNWGAVSKQAKDLVCRLLTMDPEKRISAKEALAHPFFKILPQDIPLDINTGAGLVAKFRRFAHLNILQQLALTTLAHNVDHPNIESARALFSMFDADYDGVLTVTEIIKTLQSAGVLVTNEIHGYLEAIDTDGNGTIDYTEFLTLLMRPSTAFQNDGEVREVFRILGGDLATDTLTAKSLAGIISIADVGGSNRSKGADGDARRVARDIALNVTRGSSTTVTFQNFLDALRAGGDMVLPSLDSKTA